MLLHVHEMACSRLLSVSLWCLPISALLQSPAFCIFNLAKINQPFLTLSLLLKLYLELWGLKPSDASSDEINICLSFMASNVLVFPHPSLLTVNSNHCFIISFFFFTFNFVITIPYLPSLFFFPPNSISAHYELSSACFALMKPFLTDAIWMKQGCSMSISRNIARKVTKSKIPFKHSIPGRMKKGVGN